MLIVRVSYVRHSVVLFWRTRVLDRTEMPRSNQTRPSNALTSVLRPFRTEFWHGWLYAKFNSQSSVQRLVPKLERSIFANGKFFIYLFAVGIANIQLFIVHTYAIICIQMWSGVWTVNISPNPKETVFKVETVVLHPAQCTTFTFDCSILLHQLPIKRSSRSQG